MALLQSPGNPPANALSGAFVVLESARKPDVSPL
jgi:hypothetical protein